MTTTAEPNGARRRAALAGLVLRASTCSRSRTAAGTAAAIRPTSSTAGPVIGICNSWSELTTCNAHLRIVAEHVKRGVWEAGGLPLEFPTMSLGESMMKPTTMLWRNLMSMDVEESLRANPLDGVVLLCGCDKTTPAQLMGAASVDLPTICMPGGPMLNGQWRDEEVGSGTDLWRISDMRTRGEISDEEYLEIEAGYSRSDGHCNTMGTASTMTVDGRGARHDADGRRGDPGRRLAPARARPRHRAAHRADGARRPAALADPHAGGVPQRDRDAARARRLDERRHPPAGDRRAASASTCRSSASTSSRARCRSSPISSPPASS